MCKKVKKLTNFCIKIHEIGRVILHSANTKSMAHDVLDVSCYFVFTDRYINTNINNSLVKIFYWMKNFLSFVLSLGTST